MPFFRSARIELVGAGAAAIPGVKWARALRALQGPAQPCRLLPRDLSRPSARPSAGTTWSCSTPPRPKAAATGPGSFVGTSFIFSHNAVLNTLEGDPRFFFDDSQTPQAYGTGTEEWGGGGDYWGGRNMTLPFAGHPVGAQEREGGQERRGQDRIGLPLPAGRPDAVRQERADPAGARRHNESTEHYETVTYWYGLPAPSLVKTDELQSATRRASRPHQYASPDASPALRDHVALRVGRGHAEGRRRSTRRTRTAGGPRRRLRSSR